MSPQKVLVLKNFSVPLTIGNHFRLLCLSGAKKGDSFFLQSERLLIGRAEHCDIQIVDSKTSREHAELVKIEDNFILTDLKSQNGVFVNEIKVNQQSLKENDRIIIGKTVFKFNKITLNEHEIKDRELKADRLKIVDNHRKSEVDKQNNNNNKSIDSNEDFEEKEEEKKPVSIFQDKKKRTILMIVGVILLSLFIIDDNPPDDKKGKKKEDDKKASDATKEVNTIIQNKKLKEDKELEKNLNIIFQRGLRETREGNYFRAINEFNLALILSPQNGRASFYLRKVTQILDDEIKSYFINGRRFAEALQYSSAVVQYCKIVRLLQNFPEDQRYKDAEANIKDIERFMGKDEGEIKCLSR